MDRYWFLTSTFYGNWLPGDPRGFVGRVNDKRPGEEFPIDFRRKHNRVGTDFDRAITGLSNSAARLMRGEPVRLSLQQAEVLLSQFHETAAHRGWTLIGAAIMANHVHVVVGVSGDPEPSRILGDLKSYGSRALNARWPSESRTTWWTASGSTRKLPDERAVAAATAYIREQPFPLRIWMNPDWINEDGPC
jgi:REP element-mobilizing transposase RayT